MKKYKKSSQLLGKKLILYSLIMAGTITASEFALSACYNDKPEKIEYLDSVDDRSEIIILNNNDFKNIKIYRDTNIDIARKIISNINYDFINEDDLELKQEMIDDNISTYLEALNKVNESNPLNDLNMYDYAIHNFDQLHSEVRDSDTVLAYNALAYKRLIDNNININDALEELNSLIILQTIPTEIDEQTYNEKFKLLISTLNNGENVYEIYSPLAYDIHLISCNDEHTFNNDNLICNDLKEKNKVLIK